MSETGTESPKKISRRTFLKGAAGLVGAALVGKVGVDVLTPKAESLVKSSKKIATAKELLGEDYKTTWLNPEDMNRVNTPNVMYDIKSQGEGFRLPAYTEQKDIYYLGGLAWKVDEVFGAANVSMKIALLESKDGRKRYLAFSILTASLPNEYSFNPDSIQYEIVSPGAPPISKGKWVTQKEAEQYNSIFVTHADRPQLEGDEIKILQNKGGMLFIRLLDPDSDRRLQKPTVGNIIGALDFFPTRVYFQLKDSSRNDSITFTADKRPEK